MMQRRVDKKMVRMELQHSEEHAARVWDLSAICLNVDLAKINFPMSDYESGGQWAEQANEARSVDIEQFAEIWSRRARQRVVNGVLTFLAHVILIE
jgi:hypothetical protein